MQDLIERLEKATGPARLTDAEIAATIQVVPEFDRSHYVADATFEFEPQDDGSVRIFVNGRIYHRRTVPAYTASIDAALTLVPPGFPHAMRAINVEGEMEFAACIDYGPWRESRVNLAVALCVAALKARSI